MKIMNKLRSQRGMAAIFTVLVIGSASLIIARSAAFLSMGGLDTTFISDKEREVGYLAEGCVEESLRRLQLDSGYVANNFILAQENGLCSISVSNSGGSDRIIEVLGTIDNYHKKIKAELTINSDKIIINKWSPND